MIPGPDTHRFKLPGWRKPAVIVLALAVLTAMGACVLTPTPTSAPPPIDTQTLPDSATCPPSVLLADSAEVLLKHDARLAVLGLSDPPAGHLVSLSLGEIVINSVLPPDIPVEVVSPNGFIAQLAGSRMIVAYEGEGGQFTLACVEGTCKIGPDADHLTLLAAGSQASLDEDGNYLGPFAITLQDLPADCTVLTPVAPPTETPTATLEPGITPDLNATATAACKEFHELYPLTPTCP